MPSLPPGLGEWLQPGLLTGVLGLLWYEIKASEARQGKRLDELRADMKELRADMKADIKELRAGMKELRADMQAGEARQREDNRALGEKLDRLVEALLTAKQL